MPVLAAILLALVVCAAPSVRAQGGGAGALEQALTALRGRTSERAAFSAVDTRRYGLARRLLVADPASGLAHEELALRALLEFDWRRQRARRQGRWDSTATRGMSGGANRARREAERQLAAALLAEPDRASAHRLRLRLAALAGDDAALARAADALLAARPADPDAALFAGLAAWRTGRADAAASFFARARRAFPASDARALDSPFELLTADEREGIGADSTAAAERAWRARDPLRLTVGNERRLEHAARLALADLLFGRPDLDRRGWRTARGEVFLRYGPPDYDAAWLDADHQAKRFGRVHRWVYSGPDGFALTFEDAFRGDDLELASSSTGEDDVTRARSLFRTTPERYAFRPLGGALDVAALASAFRGRSGATDLVVAYRVPGLKSGPLAAGAFLLDADAEVAAEARRAAERPILASDSIWTDALTLSAAPGAYALAVEAAQPAQHSAGAVRADLDVPRFAPGALAVSDLLLATEAVEGDGLAGPGVVRRGGWSVRSAVEAAFGAGAPIHVYVEAYGLGVRDGRAAYEVDVQLRPRDEAGSLGHLARWALGRRPPSGVAVRFDAEAAATRSDGTADDAQTLTLDAAGQPPGSYTLTVRIRDRATGSTAQSSRAVVLR